MTSALRCPLAWVPALALLLVRSRAQSFFGFPPLERSPGRRAPLLWPGEAARRREMPWRAPCPKWEAMRVQPAWQEGPDGHFTLRADLPRVRPQDRQVFLSTDGGRLHVRARRPLPPGGHACLPEVASVSADGRHELLDVAVPMPALADPSGVTLRQARHGLEIAAPRRKARPAPAVPGAAARNEAVGLRPTPAVGLGPKPAVEGASRAGSELSRPPAPKPPVLPYPSDGVEVLDGHEGEEEEVEEKSPDAAAGWWDNRGEFHEY